MHIVQHVDAATTAFDQLGGRQTAARTALVDIAADGGHRRYRAQSIQDGGIADIAGVENMLRTLQGFQRFRTQQTVRVRNDADARV